MGVYINPSNMSKEKWLHLHGHLIGGDPPETHTNGSKMAVVLVGNNFFTAAGVAFSDDELSVFADPADSRPKLWFWVEKSDLDEVCGPMLDGYIEESKTRQMRSRR